jgi:DNA-binding LytR/AlgR family response regulator
MPMLRLSQPRLEAAEPAGSHSLTDAVAGGASVPAESARACEHADGSALPTAAGEAPADATNVARAAATAATPVPAAPPPSLPGEGLLDRLPLAIGRQLVSISADLHYLQVVTRRGRATVLGSLAEVESELGQRGLRIHRSHWVALDAIRRLHRNAQGWRCELQDGRSLPVSRRRAAEIKERLGRDFVIDG